MTVLLAEDRDGVRMLRLNRPEKRNALDVALMSALEDAMVEVNEDPTIGAVVITGAPPLFSAGADIGDLARLEPSASYHHMRWGQAIFDRIDSSPTPVVAAINGHAFGGGLELALACDLRFITPHATLAQKEITLENIPGWGGTQRLPRLVGEGRAKEMILLGTAVDASWALAGGLVNEVVEGDVLARAHEVAREIAGRSPVAIANAKSAIHAVRQNSHERGLEQEASGVAACFQTERQQEAIAAFMNRSRSDKDGEQR